MEIVRIGVLGCAAIAERSFIPAIQALSAQFKLVAVASRSLEKAELLAVKFDCEAIEGYNSLIARTDIDALYIPLPTGLHREYIVKALNSGKHVYAEKSIAMCLADAQEFVDIAKLKGLALMEGYMFRYHNQHKKVFELLNAGAIGELRQFSASFGFPPLKKDNFRYDSILGGGALLDCAGYVVSAALLLVKDDLFVEGASLYYENGASIYGSAFLSNKKGIGCAISFGFDNFYQCTYQLWGSNGMIIVPKAFTPKEKEVTKIILKTAMASEEFNIVADNHFVKALQEFYHIINSSEKKKHYDEIIKQSNLLEIIEKKGKAI